MLETILNIVLAVLSVALAGATYYLDVKKKIQEEVDGKINAAEDTKKSGDIKMELVVNSIYYDIVPKILRPILNKKAIENIVQKAFVQIEEYAQKQAEKTK